MQQLKGAVLILAVSFTLGAGGLVPEPHPRSSELKTTPHNAEKAPPKPQRPDAQPRPALPMAPLGYEGSEHRDGIHHGSNGHHNWHLKGGRH